MSKLFYNNPRLALLTVFLIIASGIGALLTLGRQEDPTLSERFAIIITNYPGASAERVEALVTDPLESAIKELFEIQDTTSTSQNGVSIITVELKEEFRGDKVEPVWTQVREQINKGALLLPPEAGIPDLRRQSIGADSLILAFSMEKDFEQNIELIGRLARDLQLKFKNLAGTERTTIYGAVKPEIILMDEPCSALDPIATAKIEELIDELKKEFTIIIVTHSMQQAARVSDNTAFFYLGELIEFGDTRAIFTKPLQQRTEDYITGRFG